MLERVKAEGKNSPADLLMTVDAGNLIDLVEAGVTQPVESDALKAAIPANLRGADNQWFALSMRARVLYAEKSMPIDNWHYEQLASPEYKGKVCIRSGQHPYNTALIAAMIAHHGEAKTEEWLRGVKANPHVKQPAAIVTLPAISSAGFVILASPTPITSVI